jgi:hypothetical protein
MANIWFPKYFALILIFIGLFFSAINWICMFQSWRQKHFISVVPFVGTIPLWIGLLGFESTRPFAFVSIFADWGTLVFLCAIPKLAKHAWQISRFCLIRQLKSQSNHATYTLKLFKGGIFVLKIDFDPPQVCNEHAAKIISSGMQGHWQQDNSSILLTEYRDSWKTVLTKINDSIYLSKESAYPEDKECKYDSLDNLEFQLL